MSEQRYSSVSGEDKPYGSVDAATKDGDAALQQQDDRREQCGDKADVEKTDLPRAAQPKQLPAGKRTGRQQRLDASDEEDEGGKDAAEAAEHGFHPARLDPAPSTSLLHSSSSSSSPLSRLRSFLRLHLNRYYVVLLVALLAISCSGTLLRELPNTPPLLKVLSVGFVYQYREADSALIDRFLSNQCLLAILVGGLAASAHFAFWIWSLNHTSLAHSLFFVSCYPLVTVAVMLVQRKRIEWKEAAGVLLGLAGSAALLADTSATAADAEGSAVVPVSMAGDVVAFLGAVVFVAYLYAGRSVRGWLPLFLYTCPMTFVSCVPLLFFSLLLEDVTFRGFTPSSIFGFLAPSSLLVLCLIAVLPAGLGHTGINFALHHVSPLAISVVLTLEPVLGVVVGVLAGVEAAPSWLTLMGGCGGVVGCVTAIVGTHQRETREKADGERRATEGDGEGVKGKEDVEDEGGAQNGELQNGTKVELILPDAELMEARALADSEVQEKTAWRSDEWRERDEESAVLHVDNG